MPSLVDVLLSNGTIVQTGICQYACKCGKTILKSSLRAHVKSSYHMEKCNNPVLTGSNQCDICCTEKKQFYICHVCKNKHCSDCHPHMTKCPFCRKVFGRRRGKFVIAPEHPVSQEQVCMLILSLTRLIGQFQ